MDRTDPRPDAGPPAGSRISRRKVLAGGLLFVGGSSMLVESDTAARFSDGESASGDVRVASVDATVLDRSTPSEGPEYRLFYETTVDDQVDGVAVTVSEERPDGSWEQLARYPASENTATEGYVDWEKQGNGGYDTDRYEFEFSLVVDGDAVLTKRVLDVPDGTDPSSNDDLSEPDDPVLERFTVVDRNGSGDRTEYDVSWELSNADGFDGHVLVTFTNTVNGYGDEEIESPLGGSVSYPQGGPYSANWASFEVAVRVVESDTRRIVASGSVTDDPDGNDAAYGG